MSVTNRVESSLDSDKEIQIEGRIPRVARIKSEFIKYLDCPKSFIEKLVDSDISADVFTYISSPYSELESENPGSDYCTFEDKAILNITTYEHWWKKQVNDKTRNMVRKSGKKGATIEISDYNEKFVQGIYEIYNETPIRQGRPYGHYGKSLDQVREANSTFSEISDYIGIWFKDELIGFAKVLKLEDYSVLMQIVAKISHRDKSPTNALLAKAVEICAEKGSKKLMYGIWSRGTLGDFKIKNGFERVSFPRYHVPLNKRGLFSLKLGLHQSNIQKMIDKLPEKQYRILTNYRTRLHYFLNRNRV